MDFRSDTVTQPCATMREHMANASVGDDVYGDDPCVNELEQWAAQRHGFESAIFCSSGTQANLLALMAHCQRGDEYLCGQQAHNYRYEGGGAAILGSIQPQPIENEKDGTLCFKKLAAAIKPDDIHFAQTRLLSLENTINGKVLPLEYLKQARQFATSHKLSLHLDGARVYNASVAANVDIVEISQHFDSMTICLSKGLGAPVGSLLLGSPSLIKQARRWRKVLGGGMRQAGILAAAGKYALTNNIERLAQDHANARKLAIHLAELPYCQVNPDNVSTNMVFVRWDDAVDQLKLATELSKEKIIVTPGTPMRLVTHLDISDSDIDTFIAAVKRILG
ncbi:low-specificity L-threonine aldolase [Thaumasiovibrio sp. DFM-14]|uniref:low-specificity L-threonine aldolase n=1 Tax=Thaumasiovibrio sp. DFM-14 TaxID=3384792 RepID=UPI0039A000DD